MAKHERAAAFEGADGQPYSVGIYVDDEPDEKGRYGAALLFVRWAPSGDRPIGHVETPTKTSELGAKGAGEAGTAGAPAAVMNAINDALAPLGARVTVQPFTPERILKALGKV